MFETDVQSSLVEVVASGVDNDAAQPTDGPCTPASQPQRKQQEEGLAGGGGSICMLLASLLVSCMQHTSTSGAASQRAQESMG